MGELEITAIVVGAMVSAFLYGIGIGRAYRWARPKWGTASDNPATFFFSAFWPIHVVWLPIALGARIGARERASLPKAQVRK